MVIQGCKEIKMGTAAPSGTMPTSLAKMGKVYKESCELVQEDPEVTRHFEEGKMFAIVTVFEGKVIGLKLQFIADGTDALEHIGGTTASGTWSISESSQKEAAIKIVTDQGLDFDIPNAVYTAKIVGKLSKKDIVRVEVMIEPQEVEAGDAFRAVPKAA